MPLTKADYEKQLEFFRAGNVAADIAKRLVPLWCDDYRRHQNPKAVLVEVEIPGEGTSFTYLFDLNQERNIVAYGIPAFAKHKRDARRMKGHPLPDDPKYHRGHLMAHSIGGGTDINLVPQLGKLNIGSFRVLEERVRRLAQEHIQCFYFVRTIYKGNSNIPSAFEQGIIEPSRQLTYMVHEHS